METPKSISSMPMVKTNVVSPAAQVLMVTRAQSGYPEPALHTRVVNCGRPDRKIAGWLSYRSVDWRRRHGSGLSSARPEAEPKRRAQDHSSQCCHLGGVCTTL